MNLAKEATVRATVKSVLLKLSDGRTWTRGALFGRTTASDEERSRRILGELARRGLVKSAQLKGGEPKLHEAIDAGKLAALAHDESELSRLIWPGRSRLAAPELQAAYDSLAEASLAPPSAPVPTDEKLDTILRLVAALTENVIYLREKVDALNSVACSHCNEPEAHR